MMPRLLRRLQLALKPAYRPFGFRGVWPITIKTLERARPLAVGWQRQNQIRPALRASRSVRLAHGGIVPPLRKSVKLKRIRAGFFVQLAASGHPKIELLDDCDTGVPDHHRHRAWWCAFSLNGPALICLAGPAPSSKIFLFIADPNQIYISAIPSLMRGVSRSSRTRDGMRWTRTALLTRAHVCGRRSRVVLTPRRWRQVCAMAMSALTGLTRRAGEGDKQARSPGRARRKPLKLSRAGMPGVAAYLW
jgi:hypothetical protein